LLSDVYLNHGLSWRSCVMHDYRWL